MPHAKLRLPMPPAPPVPSQLQSPSQLQLPPPTTAPRPASSPSSPQSSHPVSSPSSQLETRSSRERLLELKTLREDGLITEEEYTAYRQSILAAI